MLLIIMFSLTKIKTIIHYVVVSQNAKHTSSNIH